MTAPPGFQVSPMWPQLVALYCTTLLPLAAGLPPIIATMESVCVMTGREVWRQAARFWGRLFGVALLAWALGTVALAGLYVADPQRLGNHFHGLPGPVAVTLALPVAYAGGWLLWTRFRDWLNPHRLRHLLVTWVWVALSGVAALKVAVGYGVLDNPLGVDLDPGSLRLWIRDWPAVLLNPAAQSRFVHLMGACYLTAAAVVLAVSAWYLLHGRNVRIARRSLTVAAAFGFAAALSLVVLGDRAGYASSPGQQMRIAAIAAAWHTGSAPAPFTLFGFPDGDHRVTRGAIAVPWALGLGATHSWRKAVAGMDDLEAANASRIRDGIAALTALDTPWGRPDNAAEAFDLQDNPNLGYALLLLRGSRHPAYAGEDAIAAAARGTIPGVPLLFWTFRGMLLAGALSIALFGSAFWLASRRRLESRGFLRFALCSLPVPWIAGALGWVVSEAGRGPWLADGLLPVTVVHAGHLQAAIGAIGVVVVVALSVAACVALVRLVRTGPDGLKLWPGDPEQAGKY